LKVSVIIPVLRDWDLLEKCLTLLRPQVNALPDHEIIVVDNGPQELAVESRPVGARYIHCPRGFSYAARNAGLAVAKGDIIAFTDADCLPSPNWLAAGCQSLLSDPSIDLAGGQVEVFAENNSLCSLYECIYSFRQDENVQKAGVSVTANLFVRSSVFSHIGTFREDFESGGDYEFCKRATNAGHRIAYVPEAVIRHPARSSLSSLLRRRARVARGHYQSNFVARNVGFMESLWRAALLFRPGFSDWKGILTGSRSGSPASISRRIALLSLRVLLQYHYAVLVFLAVLNRRRHTHAGQR
jgi:glycosyltransferase involved in cell wall biosynthesis